MKSSTSIACVFALAAAVGLAGCGGSSSNLGSLITPGDTPTGATTDAFFAAVSKLVANTPDDSEADQSAFDAAVATAPDDTEPQPLG
jgi:hypothetical protein